MAVEKKETYTVVDADGKKVVSHVSREKAAAAFNETKREDGKEPKLVRD